MQDFFRYNVQSLFVGGVLPYNSAFENLATTNLEGIQSADITLSWPREDQFTFDGGGNQEMIVRPRADLSFSYIFASGQNEDNIGFVLSNDNTVSALANINAERNYYLLYNEDGNDLTSYSGYAVNKVMAFGNAVLNNYSFTAAVGRPSLVSVGVSALNLLLQSSGSGQGLPAIYKNSGISAAGTYTLPFTTFRVNDYFESRPSSLALTFDTGCAFGAFMSGQNSCPLQSFSFAINLSRQDMAEIGWAYPETRPVQWPVDITINADAYLNRIQLDSLNRFNCPDSGFSFSVAFNSSCNGDQDAFTFRFNGAKLNGERISSSIGSLTRVTFDWSARVYDINRIGPTDPNFFMSATGQAYNSIVFPQVEYTSGNSPLTFTLDDLCYLTILSGPGILNGNEVLVTEDPSTVVVRAVTTDGSDTDEITVTVT